MYISTCVYVYNYVSVCLHICILVYMYISIYMCVNMCVCVALYVEVRACGYIFVASASILCVVSKLCLLFPPQLSASFGL